MALQAIGQLRRSVTLRRVRWWYVAATVAAVFSSPPAAAQSASISGRVLVDGDERPIASVEILLDNLGRSARTDSAGKYLFASLPGGQHHITVRHVGYEPFQATLTLKENEKVDADFVLKRLTVLSPVDVNAPYAGRLQEFENRRKAGFGRFLTFDQVARESHMSVTSILSKHFSALTAKSIDGYTVLTARGQRCPIQILVNDFVVYNGDPIYYDVNGLQSMNILGVEFYTPMNTPIEYMKRPRGNTGGAGCGTMIIWTK